MCQKDLSAGLPDFNRYTSKVYREERVPFGSTPHPYDYETIKRGYHMGVKQDKDTVPFKMQLPRDNLFERVSGLPKQSKEEMVKMSKQYESHVDFREFLPNSMVNSARKKVFSNSYKTQSFGYSKKASCHEFYPALEPKSPMKSAGH